MENRKVTLKDLARETGLSVNSVSLALRGMRVSEESRRKVREAAERLGYVGNAQASSIRTGVTRSVAVIVGDIANPHTAGVLKGCVAALSKEQYHVIIFSSEEDEQLERNAISAALRQNVDGVLISPVRKDGKNIDRLARSGVPTVVFGSSCKNPLVSSVCLDDEHGGYLAAMHLLDSGSDSVLFVNGPKQVQGAQERLRGYLRAMKQRGRRVDEKDVISADLKNDRSWQEPLRERLLGAHKPVSILAYSDMHALRIYSFCADNNLPVKRIAGFDNALQMMPAAMRFPSVAERDETIAAVAPRLLLERMQKPMEPSRCVVLEAGLYNI